MNGEKLKNIAEKNLIVIRNCVWEYDEVRRVC